MSFHQYGPEDFKKLLKAIDAHLDRKVDIILIGGTAALLAYKATRLTQDIDSFTKITAVLQKAYELAKKETGLDIPLSQAGVADAPYHFEDRLLPYRKIAFKHLNVLIPEIHDFILMKTIRGYEHDLEVIEEISKKNKVNKDILIRRFEDEMDHVIGNKNRLKLNFAAVLARCFGQGMAEVWMKKQK